MLAIYALIGNDVCNGHADTLADMTSPQDYYNAVVAAFDYLVRLSLTHARPGERGRGC